MLFPALAGKFSLGAQHRVGTEHQGNSGCEQTHREAVHAPVGVVGESNDYPRNWRCNHD